MLELEDSWILWDDDAHINEQTTVTVLSQTGHQFHVSELDTEVLNWLEERITRLGKKEENNKTMTSVD